MKDAAALLAHAQSQLPNYTLIAPLYQGSRTTVYRAIEQTTQQSVVIKVLSQDYPSFSELVQFRNQYTVTQNLAIAGIIRTFALIPFGNSYALVMEDFGGVDLSQYAQQQSLSLTTILQIAIQLAKILHDLHQHCVIHKDLKPANILIHPETQQIKLIDFSIASLLPRETGILQSSQSLEGTLAYIAPEQTGRMNRAIDYRTDFYALGVTLYQLLTGRLPFVSDDPLELIHCHMAQMPPAVQDLNPAVPTMVGAIVAKLMAKNAEERYQSAIGLQHDLETCFSQWQSQQKIANFTLGDRDLSDRFIIPEKLYGRETEVQLLLDAFDRVAQGGKELMLVAGFSGIGKTAVVNEVHKPIVRQRGYFIKGKFDQFNRDIPFSAFVQAFQDLVRQLLSESEAELQVWRLKLTRALGENAQVIVDLIPELEQIIGPQAPAPFLSGSAVQNRFQLLFQRFIKVFTTVEHPLVFFLDDLQWADSASLSLIQLLMWETKITHLLFIGAYRDNEVSPAHPLMLTLNEIAPQHAYIQTLTLHPLSRKSLNQLIADTLQSPGEIVQPLTELVLQKTEGNPFFVTQFLKTLHQDKSITFNRALGYWQCDIGQVRHATLSENVVDFMAAQLQKLPPSTQDALKIAACIGAQFTLETLAIVSQTSPTDVATHLWKALQEGLILPQSEIYKFYLERAAVESTDRHPHPLPPTLRYQFAHDRIQQAAYALIPAAEKQWVHCQIGTLLLQNMSIAAQDERRFEIVGHLNAGRAHIGESATRSQLVQLNLQAAQKAKAATAYDAAVEYLLIGLDLLPPDSWMQAYDVTLTLHTELVEALYLNTEFERMEPWAQAVLQHAHALLDTIKVQQMRIMAYKAQGQLLASLQLGLQVLQSLGVDFPEQPTAIEVQAVLQTTAALWAGQSPLQFVDLPMMTDPERLAAMDIMTNLIASAYRMRPTLLPLLVAKQVVFSLQSGNCAVSVFAYADYGLVLCGMVGDLESGYAFGQLAIAVLERLQAHACRCRTLFIVNYLVSHWRDPLRSLLKPLQMAYQSGIESGDLESTALSAYVYCHYSFWSGQELVDLSAEIEAYEQGIRSLKQVNAHRYVQIAQQTVFNLLDLGETPWELQGTADHRERWLTPSEAERDHTEAFDFFLHQTMLLYLFGQQEAAARSIATQATYIDGGISQFSIALYTFYAALIHLAGYANVSATEQPQILAEVNHYQQQLRQWADFGPCNHQHRWELVEAERYRVLDEPYKAGDFYDRAIAQAQANAFIQDEALANELAARFYLHWGKTKVAAGYLQAAYYCYSRWGAKAKVVALETQYPEMLQPILQQSPGSNEIMNTLMTIVAPTAASSSRNRSSSSHTTLNQTFDFASILKASQALSSTIQLDQLLPQLTAIILQNSGADRCALLLLNGAEDLQIHAIATPKETQLYTEPLTSRSPLPIKLIQYVKNTAKLVVIDDLVTDLPILDIYLSQCQPPSILALPLLNQGRCMGVIVLENHFTSGIFTQERIVILNFLCSQAAIALENARLYQQVQQAFADLQQAQLQLVQNEKMSALGNLVAGVAHEINNPVGCILGNVGATQAYINDLLGLLDLYAAQFPEPGLEIEEELETVELDYVREDLPKLIRAMKDSGDRIKAISKSLRVFSRADTESKQPFNLHEGIDSTVLILRHRLKANEHRPAIDVITDYGNLPEINCFPGQLNQVFMNILANAIDALDEISHHSSFAHLKANPQRITIQTRAGQEEVKVAIADNGPGIPDDIKTRIFDHLFTTKGVHKGTGLGLAIARQIVEDTHGGQLNVQSTVGQGTEFCLHLPIAPIA